MTHVNNPQLPSLISTKNQSILTYFPTSNALNIAKRIASFRFSKIHFRNKDLINWFLQISSFSMKTDIDDISLSIWDNFYVPFLFLETEEISDSQFYLYFLRQAFYHFSFCFSSNSNAPIFLQDINKLINKNSIFFDEFTWNYICRIFLGICSNSFSYSKDIIKSLFQLTFKILSYSSPITTSGWNLFYCLLPSWPYSPEFQSKWLQSFFSVFSLIESDPSIEHSSSASNNSPRPLPSKFDEITKSNSDLFELAFDGKIDTMIQLLITAHYLENSPNSEILHKGFNMIAKHTRNNTAKFSPYLESRHSVDQIFSIFSKWGLTPSSSSSSSRSIDSFMTILEKCQLSQHFQWFQVIFEFIQTELHNSNVHSPIIYQILLQLNNVLCVHTSSFSRLTGPIMKYLEKSNDISLPHIIALVLSISELYIHENPLYLGSIPDIQNITEKLFIKNKIIKENRRENGNNSTEHSSTDYNIISFTSIKGVELLLDVTSGLMEHFKRSFLDIFPFCSSSDLLFYLYFSILICPSLFQDESSFLLVIFNLLNIKYLNEASFLYPFLYSIIELSNLNHLFQYNSEEFTSFVKKYQFISEQEHYGPECETAFQFCFSSLIAGHFLTDYSTLPVPNDPNWFHYLLSSGIASFKLPKNEEEPVYLIYRDINGVYTYSISEPNYQFIDNDINVNNNNDLSTLSDIESQSFTISPPETMTVLDDCFKTMEINEFQLLSEATSQISFQNPSNIIYENPSQDWVFSFFVHLGVINESFISHIHDLNRKIIPSTTSNINSSNSKNSNSIKSSNSSNNSKNTNNTTITNTTSSAHISNPNSSTIFNSNACTFLKKACLSDIAQFLASYNLISPLETIEIGIMHFTTSPNSSSPPGHRGLTPGLARLHKNLGKPLKSYKNFKNVPHYDTSIFRFVFFGLENAEQNISSNIFDTCETLIIFNETSCIPIQNTFQGDSFSAKTIIEIEEKDNGIYKMQLLKGKPDIPYPIVGNYHRLISKQTLTKVMALIASLTQYHNNEDKLQMNRSKRQALFESLYNQNSMSSNTMFPNIYSQNLF